MVRRFEAAGNRALPHTSLTRGSRSWI